MIFKTDSLKRVLMVEHFLPVSSALWFTVPGTTPDISKCKNFCQFACQKSVERILDRFDIQWNNLIIALFHSYPCNYQASCFVKNYEVYTVANNGQAVFV